MKRPITDFNWSMALAGFVVALAATCATARASTFTTVSLAGVANDQLSFINPAYPTGQPVILGAVPFDILSTGNNVFNTDIAAAHNPGTITLTVPINMSGVAGVHTLINTSWGQPGPGSLASLTFTFTDATTVVTPLVGDVDIRDHLQNTWTNSINGTTTTNVFTTTLPGHAGEGTYRMDKQFFDLSNLSGKTLASVTLTDNGDYEFQRTYLVGLTVQSVPEPSTYGLMVLGFMVLSMARRLRLQGFATAKTLAMRDRTD